MNLRVLILHGNDASRRRAFALASLLLFGLAALLYSVGGRGQAPMSNYYQVKADDSLQSIAESTRPKEATVNQMAVALARANADVFKGRPAGPIPSGTKLAVPDAATVMKVDAAAAQREFSRITRAEQHFRAGNALEKSKDMFYAFNAYVEAAKLGHGPAQKRLGELYDNDLSGFVKHDLQESIRWYERARDSKVDISKQGQRNPGNR